MEMAGNGVFVGQPGMERANDGGSVSLRWEIEVFFKEIKQTLQLADFLGHNANAVRWQYGRRSDLCALRFCAWISKWDHSFTRLFTLLRSLCG